MKNIKSALALLTIGAAAAAPAAGQELGWYAGGSIGYAQYKGICKTTNLPCDSTDTAWHAFGGYQFSRHLAAELAYGNLGEAKAENAFRMESKGWDLSALGSFPITGRLDALVRLGIYRARTTLDADGASTIAGGGDTNSGFTYGAGLGTNFGKVGLRVEWQRYANVGGNSVPEDDIDVFSLGALFRF